MDEGRRIELEVGGGDAGQRFDVFVAKGAAISRRRAMELIADGKVRVGRRAPKKGERTEAGQKVQVDLPAPEAPVPQPELALDVLHEDAHVLALDKPAGMNMHPLRPGERGTLANAVLARYPDVSGASPEERCPGLVHRLDRETSGVVLWARRRAAFDALRGQFSAKTVEKRYVALVEGFVEGAGELSIPLAHDPADARKMMCAPYPAEAEELKARPATTVYRVLGHDGGASLLEVTIPTGVMHQIRAHLAFTGHPVLGDTLYGGKALDSLGRHFLHAIAISFDHPEGRHRLTVRSPLPADLAEALQKRGIRAPV